MPELNDLKDYLSEQYAMGTPVTVTYRITVKGSLLQRLIQIWILEIKLAWWRFKRRRRTRAERRLAFLHSQIDKEETK